MAKLLVQESNGSREFELVDLEVNIGRELDNTLRLSDPSISRHHAVIRLGQDGYEIHDLQSSNGVLLNGNKVPSGPLHDGDRITLGQMQLTFVDPPRPPAGPASPLGTVRMDADALAKLWAGPPPEIPPAQASPQEAPPVPPQVVPAVPLPAAGGSPVRGGLLSRFSAALSRLFH
jgi:predicted component of type VI protein secretion system